MPDHVDKNKNCKCDKCDAVYHVMDKTTCKCTKCKIHHWFGAEGEADACTCKSCGHVAHTTTGSSTVCDRCKAQLDTVTLTVGSNAVNYTHQPIVVACRSVIGTRLPVYSNIERYYIEGWYLDADYTQIITLETVFDKDTVIYPNLLKEYYIVNLNYVSCGIIDNVEKDSNITGHNMNLTYTASTRLYHFYNTGEDDPYAVVEQKVYLEANTSYYVHMDVMVMNATETKDAVQLYYGKDGAFSEDNSLLFDRATTSNYFTVTETGTYALRFDNNTDKSIYISNFWISEADTMVGNSINVYTRAIQHNFSLLPTRLHYLFDGYYDINGIKYVSAEGDFVKVIKDDVELFARWSEIEGYYYVRTAYDLNNIRNNYSSSANKKTFYVVNDIWLTGEWTPLNSFDDIIDGAGHIIYGMTINHSAVSGDDDVHLGFIGTNNTGKLLNINFMNCSITVGSGHNGKAWVFAGIAVGKQYASAKIINVNVYDSSVTVHRHQSEIGGIAGYSCHMSNCNVYGVTIYGNGDEGAISGGGIGEIISCHAYGFKGKKTVVKHYATSTTRSVGGIIGYNNEGTVKDCTIQDIAFELEGDVSKPSMGYIVGSQNSGKISLVGMGDGCTRNPESAKGNKCYFAVGWGYAGLLKNNPTIE
jgi:hypothetical protein